MSKNLVIVESPAKAKTIEKYLGKDFTVLSSVGHIRSIIKKSKDKTPPIDIKNGFKPTYEIDPEKRKIVAELRKAVKSASEVWLATDEDREGEAIAWHLCEVLKLDPKTTKRIVFHEITKDAITSAIKKPRTVDNDLVRAQQARQVMDRLVGFELSPVVWQKVPGGKSAGRVQSPAVKLIVEREREIDSFEANFDFKVTANFLTASNEELPAELNVRPKTEDIAKALLEKLPGSSFTIDNIAKSPSTRNPSAPFTTSTLQQEANSRLNFSSKATMASAQRLYQSGKITYMRTDSVNLSKQALAQINDYVKKQYGDDYQAYRTFKTKSASAQEAHEAIRPTDISVEIASADSYDQKLYDLIRRRTLASQMAPAKLEKTNLTISISNGPEKFEAKGEIILFDGFLKIYGYAKKDDTLLPQVSQGEQLKLQKSTARQTFSRPPARYSEGSLVKKLEELGIGRPSTYATILSTIQTRGYVNKGDSDGEQRNVKVLEISPNDQAAKSSIIQEKSGGNKGKLVPTSIGMLISDFLNQHFEQVVDYGFTAEVEEDFDKIANGQLVWSKMLEQFYFPFHKLVEAAGSISRASTTQQREIGRHPKNNKPIFARIGRYGPMLQLGDSEDSDEKPTFASLPKGAKLETITLEQALKAFELPRLVGKTKDGQDIIANIGRFGPFIQIDKTFVSIKPLDPHDISLQQALELYEAKLKKDAEKQIADYGDIKILNGPYGPYVTSGKKNAKIAKDIDPKSLTKDQAIKILEEAPDKKRGKRHAPSSKSKTRKK